jgi:hypothetical protein
VIRPSNYQAWAVGRRLSTGRFKVRRVLWGLTLARVERRPDEEVRTAELRVESRWRPRHPRPVTRRRQKMLCSICGRRYDGRGHNAAPVNTGRCCDLCQITDVLPARAEALRREKEKSDDVRADHHE